MQVVYKAEVPSGWEDEVNKNAGKKFPLRIRGRSEPSLESASKVMIV